MIAIDLDGTVLAGKSILPEDNLQALKRAMDAGVKLVVNTGRMIESTLPIARKLCVNAPMSLLNGALIYDMESDRILSGQTIPHDTVVALLRAIEAMGKYVQVFPGRAFYFEHRSEWTDYYEGKIGVKGVETGVPLSGWLETDAYKLLMLGEPEDIDASARILGAQFPMLNFVKSSATHLEIIAQGVDKARGLEAVCEMTGIPAEDVLAFGDEMNDLPMLQRAGFGYAMANAAPAVREATRFTAPENTKCGVASIVNLYLNEGRMGRK